MIKAYKKIGQTPLELLDELRQNKPELRDEIMSYAGRLDPIAEGEMLILVGQNENRKREKFLRYDKTYEAHILFGFATDTFDVMGLVQNRDERKISPADSEKLELVLKELKKINELPYPNFSSKVVKGKPLFQWTKEGGLDEIDTPSRKIKVKKVELLETQTIASRDLWHYIQHVIGRVNGDFRQTEILDHWADLLGLNQQHYQIAKVKFKVSSGTYIRSLVDQISQKMEIPACVLKLKRTKIHNNLISF